MNKKLLEKILIQDKINALKAAFPGKPYGVRNVKNYVWKHFISQKC